VMTIRITKLVCTVYEEVNADKHTYDRLHGHTTTCVYSSASLQLRAIVIMFIIGVRASKYVRVHAKSYTSRNYTMYSTK